LILLCRQSHWIMCSLWRRKQNQSKQTSPPASSVLRSIFMHPPVWVLRGINFEPLTLIYVIFLKTCLPLLKCRNNLKKISTNYKKEMLLQYFQNYDSKTGGSVHCYNTETYFITVQMLNSLTFYLSCAYYNPKRINIRQEWEL
jgi:hypothetical protein